MHEQIVSGKMIEGIAIINYEWKYLPLDESSIFFKLYQSVMKDRIPKQVEKEFWETYE
jgi:hypothetical protein